MVDPQCKNQPMNSWLIKPGRTFSTFSATFRCFHLFSFCSIGFTFFLSIYLIKWFPCVVQRICKYPLLLRELMRYTPKESVDHETLGSALTKIEQVVGVINERKRDDEAISKLFEIQKRFAGEVCFSHESPFKTLKFHENLEDRGCESNEAIGP